MNTKNALLALTAVSAFFSATAFAGEIYRYTDADGNVVYGDRPTSVAMAERVNIQSRATDNAAIQARAQARRDAADAAATDAANAAEEDKPPTRSERRAAAAAKQEACTQSQAQMDTLRNARRLYREDENGERTYLDQQQIQEAQDKAQEQINKNCG